MWGTESIGYKENTYVGLWNWKYGGNSSFRQCWIKDLESCQQNLGSHYRLALLTLCCLYAPQGAPGGSRLSPTGPGTPEEKASFLTPELTFLAWLELHALCGWEAVAL